MRIMLSALASLGGKSIFTFGFFRKPSVTPSFPTARLIPWSSAFLRPADASAFDSAFNSRARALPPGTPQPNAARIIPPAMSFILKLRMHPHPNHGDRSAVAIVSGVLEPLIVEAHMYIGPCRHRIVRFEDSLGTRMRQPAVAHKNAEAAGI